MYCKGACVRTLGNSCYWHSTTNMLEEDAQQFCRVRGGIVVEIGSEEENTLVDDIRRGRLLYHVVLHIIYFYRVK